VAQFPDKLHIGPGFYQLANNDRILSLRVIHLDDNLGTSRQLNGLHIPSERQGFDGRY
jgi:hypothetical protein